MIAGLRRDVPIILPVGMLIGLGWVMVFSTAAALGVDRADVSVFHHLQRQVLATALGAVGIALIQRVPANVLLNYAPHALIASSILMLAVFIPGMGKHAGGATRWLDFGRFSFQPVEILKLSVVAGFAMILASERPGQSWGWRTLVKLGVVTVAGLTLPILQKDFGSAVLMVLIGALMVWLAGARLIYLAGYGFAGVSAAAVAFVSEPYRIQRVKMFLSNWGDGVGGYQTRQALIALGTGRLFGVGPGESVQKLFYLPSAHADFIFAIIGEELGFLGTFATLALYVLLLREGLAVAQAAGSRRPRFLAAGMTLLLFFQAMWHIAVVLVLVPTKGLALPFVSYGGSSLLASMLAVGMIMRCASETEGRIVSDARAPWRNTSAGGGSEAGNGTWLASS